MKILLSLLQQWLAHYMYSCQEVTLDNYLSQAHFIFQKLFFRSTRYVQWTSEVCPFASTHQASTLLWINVLCVSLDWWLQLSGTEPKSLLFSFKATAVQVLCEFKLELTRFKAEANANILSRDPVEQSLVLRICSCQSLLFGWGYMYPSYHDSRSGVNIAYVRWTSTGYDHHSPIATTIPELIPGLSLTREAFWSGVSLDSHSWTIMQL